MSSFLAAAFHRLDTVLTGSQLLWRPQPFTEKDLPWQATHSHLYDALLALDDKQAGDLHDDPQQRIAWFQTLEPSLCDALYNFEPLASTEVTVLPMDRFDNVGIPGRKWQQIISFAAALPKAHIPLVDWCAGKGHLSRVVQSSQQQPVYSLEWDGALVAAGTALAKKQHRDIHYHHHDVMQALPGTCDAAARVHIGLHACGELHLQLLRHVTNSGAHAVAFSPCCYHKIAADCYQAMSSAAKQSQMILKRPDLHLAVQDTVTASRGERLLRERERVWRLGFDLLQRELRGVDDYLNIPSSHRSLLRQDFQAFCRWAANSQQLEVPADVDFDQYLQQGRAQYRKIYRLELLRRVFNRPLEYWLVLDRALYLEEHGYRVSISSFCERKVSPRNLLIQGQLLEENRR